MKIIIAAVLLTLILTSCALVATAIPTKTTVPRADNLSFVFKYYACSTIPLNVLDTRIGALTHTPLEETTSTTISLQLSENELNEVFQKIVAIEFFSYPSDFVIPEGYFTLTETPDTSFELSVINGTETHTVHWTTGGLVQSEYEKAKPLWELLMRITSIIYNHPEYKQLPADRVECI